MRWATIVRLRLRSLFRAERVDGELDEELAFHLDRLTEANVAAGMEPGQARREALRELGGLDRRREECRDARGLNLVDDARRDIVCAVRQLRRDPAFAVTGVLVLGLGVAATTAVFSIAYGVLLRDLPYDEPERLVNLASSSVRESLGRSRAGAADYFDWRRRQQVFEDMGLTRPVANYNLTGSGEPERLQGARVTASLFTTLGSRPLIGRTFTEDEQHDPVRASAVAVLSHGLWRRRFGADPGVVGRRILLNGSPHEVVGVMGPEFRYPERAFELWTPLYIPPAALRQRRDYSYLCVARLKPGVTLDEARAHMAVLAGALAHENPGTNQGDGVAVGPLLGEMTGPVRRPLWVLLAASGLLFLIGCGNLAILLVARTANRSRELAIRASLGATRPRLARQFLAEALPLAAGGAALGVLGARWLVALLVPLLPADLPRADEIGLHGPVLLAAVAVSAAAAFLVALAPALQVRAGVERGPSPRGRVRDGLLVAEVAGTVVLLVSAGLLGRSLARLRATDPGLRPAGVLSLHLAVNRTKHGDDAGVARYLGRLIDRVRSVPGVASVGIVNRLPLGGQTQIGTVLFEGSDAAVSADWRSASADYFAALGVPLVAGRTFDDDDAAERPAVGIVDERLARGVFGGASPIGRRFRIDAPGSPWVEIVGIVGHVRHEGLDSDPWPQVYWPYQQRTQDRMAMVVRTAADPSSLAEPLRAAIREVDPEQPLYDVRPMTDVLERTLQGPRLNTVLFGAFAGLALLLASVGLYGVVSYLTAQRRREFGVRMAVGATAAGIARLVLHEGLRRAAAGLLAGLVLSAWAAQALTSMLHGVGPLDAGTYLSAAALMGVVVSTATVVPAWRAARTDPTLVLRQD
jgi:predicted permease